MKTMFRQGDVLVVRASRLPKDLKPVERKRGRIILAEGEATGHCHAIDDALAELFEEKDGTLYLRVEAKAGADLKHEEHGTITIPPGTYEVVRQREYHPEAIRRVSD